MFSLPVWPNCFRCRGTVHRGFAVPLNSCSVQTASEASERDEAVARRVRPARWKAAINARSRTLWARLLDSETICFGISEWMHAFLRATRFFTGT
jgi:hypothetical protein